MLSREDNELVCRTGPETPMGKLFRRYWHPFLLSSELPEPDGPRRATTSPGATSNEMFRSASTRVSPTPKCLEIPRRLTRGSGRVAKFMFSRPERLLDPP
jgi:hypothetical protein